jgi:hypothetical protein
MNTKRLIALSSKLDTIKFGVYRGEDGKLYNADGTPASKVDDFKTVGGAAAALGTVGAGAAGHLTVMKNYGGEGGVAQAYKNLGRNVAAGTLGGVKSGLDNLGKRTAAAGGVFKKAAAATGTANDSPFTGTIVKAAKAFLKRPVALSARPRLIALKAKADELQLGK